MNDVPLKPDSLRRLRHVMFDIECLGQRPTAAIVQIAAVAFDDDDLTLGGYAPEDCFNVRISLDDCLRHGLTIDEKTINWWMFREEEARAAVFKGPKKSLNAALNNFARWAQYWIGSDQDYRVWSHATFDPPIVTNAFYAAGLVNQIPFNFRAYRDLRTKFEDIWGDGPLPQVERHGAAHDALSDAIFQSDVLKLTLAEERRRERLWKS